MFAWIWIHNEQTDRFVLEFSGSTANYWLSISWFRSVIGPFRYDICVYIACTHLQANHAFWCNLSFNCFLTGGRSGDISALNRLDGKCLWLQMTIPIVFNFLPKELLMYLVLIILGVAYECAQCCNVQKGSNFARYCFPSRTYQTQPHMLIKRALFLFIYHTFLFQRIRLIYWCMHRRFCFLYAQQIVLQNLFSSQFMN